MKQVCLVVMLLLGARAVRAVELPRNEGLKDFGVAYYPEAWPEERWETDLKMMRELGMNLIRIGEFNWSNFEPTEGVFDFAPYLRLLDLCQKHGMKVMMCTPTAATPKWMQADYPETEKTREDGTKPECGIRQSSCPSSERYRFFGRRIVEKMAEAFKDHPAVTIWQIDNEINVFGATRECCCTNCQAAYRDDLKRRYGTIEKLNEEFNGCFWSGRFTKWEDVRIPFTPARLQWLRDYYRFQGTLFLSNAVEQASILRRANPAWRITSNNPSCSNLMRHDVLFKDLGYVSADTYLHGVGEERHRVACWQWTMFRGLTGVQKPFMIGECGPFAFDADQDDSYDQVKPWFWLTIGHGVESFMYFRWRESVSGEETHPAVLPWSGRRGFVYDLLKRQMDEYRSLPESIARLPLDRREVAILHDADSHTYTLAECVVHKGADVMMDTQAHLVEAMERRGVLPDIVQLAEDMDLSAYRVVFAPLCFSMTPSFQAKLRKYVADGGTLVAVNRLNFCTPLGAKYHPEVCPVGLTDLFGIEIDERRSMGPRNVELAALTGAEQVLPLKKGCFKGHPLLTCQASGKGSAWYCTSTLDAETARETIAAVFARTGIAMRAELPSCVSRLTRGPYVIVVNFNNRPRTITAEAGELLLGTPAVADGRMTLKPFEVAIWRR